MLAFCLLLLCSHYLNNFADKIDASLLTNTCILHPKTKTAWVHIKRHSRIDLTHNILVTNKTGNYKIKQTAGKQQLINILICRDMRTTIIMLIMSMCIHASHSGMCLLRLTIQKHI